MTDDIFNSIKKEHITRALTEIDEKGVRPGRHSSTYDLEFEGKLYPPKYVLSLASKFASGKELEPDEFDGGLRTDAFKLLNKYGFKVIPKKGYYTWVSAHYQIADWLQDYESRQVELINVLKDLGIAAFQDKGSNGETFELREIDPFTFLFYIYKHGPDKRLAILQGLCRKLKIAPIPEDDRGLPSANAQKVWLFPYKVNRTHNEIRRLWDFFRSLRNKSVTNEKFEDLLEIQSVGKAKLTEAMFYIDPNNNFPINRRTRPYLSEKFQIEPEFETYSDYQEILRSLRSKTDEPFCKISFDATIWSKDDSNSMGEDEEEYATKNLLGDRRCWVYAPGDTADHWEEFYSKSIMGIGWRKLGDLNQYKTKEEIADRLKRSNPNQALDEM